MWYRAIGVIAIVAALIEGAFGVVANAPGHVYMAAFIVPFGVCSLGAAVWRERGGHAGPALMQSAGILALAIVVGFTFRGSPAAVLLPMVAFAFSLPSLGPRARWAMGALTIIVGGITAAITVEGALEGTATVAQLSSAVAGIVVEGLIVTVVLVRQRSDLTNYATRYTSIVEQVPVGLFRISREGRLFDANPWFAEMLGYPSEAAMLATSASDVFADPSIVDSIRSDVDTDVVRKEDVQLRRVDGTTLWARMRLRSIRAQGGEIEWIQGTVVDISDERRLARQQARLAAAIEQTADSVVITDPTGAILYVNPAFERTTGYTSGEVLGLNPHILRSGQHSAAFYREMRAELVAGHTWRGELVNRRKDGTLMTETTTITPVLDASGELSTFVAVMRDISAEREAALSQRRMEQLLSERRAIAGALAGLTPSDQPAVTADGIVAALMALPTAVGAALLAFDGRGQASVMSIQGPKALSLGVGDRLPAAMGAYLRAHALGGPWHEMRQDSVLWSEYRDALNEAEARAVAFVPIEDGSVLLGILAFATGDPTYAAEIDHHMPMLVDVATTARLLLMDSWKAERELDDVRARISGIVETRGFRPVFQPVVDLTTGLAIGFEALTRFDDGLAPDVAFAEANRVGLGRELEALTMRSALAAASALPEGPWLSLNVSPGMLLAGSELRDILADRSRSIVLEVTEHTVIEDYGLLRAAFVALGADLRLAVDDAGAGVANFSHIVELRPDFVKIDIGLIKGINADLSRQALVVGLHHFARASNRDVIAEGVESEAELATLRALDVRFAQGYLLGRPEEAAFWSTDSRAVVPLAPLRGKSSGGAISRSRVSGARG